MQYQVQTNKNISEHQQQSANHHQKQIEKESPQCPFQVCALLHIILDLKNMPQTTPKGIRKAVQK